MSSGIRVSDRRDIRTGTVALPISQIQLTTSKPNGSAYPIELITVGDHLRKRRIDLKLLQKDIGQRIGVHCSSVTNWERNRVEPELRHLPAIIAFLGYDPLPVPTTLAQRLVHFRSARGMTQPRFAAMLQVDPTTLARWERGERQPMPEYRKRVEAVLRLREEDIAAERG